MVVLNRHIFEIDKCLLTQFRLMTHLAARPFIPLVAVVATA